MTIVKLWSWRAQVQFLPPSIFPRQQIDLVRSPSGWNQSTAPREWCCVFRICNSRQSCPGSFACTQLEWLDECPFLGPSRSFDPARYQNELTWIITPFPMQPVAMMISVIASTRVYIRLLTHDDARTPYSGYTGNNNTTSFNARSGPDTRTGASMPTFPTAPGFDQPYGLSAIKK